jgi:predicted anti-sigma-YlaC factor YlaD
MHNYSLSPSLLAVLVFLCAGCSIKKMAVNKVGDALSGGGKTFASDNDPELIKAAVPFSLKLMESLLAESPRHRGLLLAATSGFTQYAYAFVQQDADELEENDFAAATAMRVRSRKLYLRARDYGLRGLATRHPGFEKRLRENAKAALREVKVAEVPLLYWTAAAWGSAISNSKDIPELVADLPYVEALIYRALELDETFDQGAVHSFLISYEMTRQGGERTPSERAKTHFDRAMSLSNGQLAGPLVSYAEAVCIPQGNRTDFEKALNQALIIDADSTPDHRLANLVMQRRARWLLAQIDKYFLPPADNSVP